VDFPARSFDLARTGVAPPLLGNESIGTGRIFAVGCNNAIIGESGLEAEKRCRFEALSLPRVLHVWFVCGWQVKLCDPILALEIKGL